MQSHPKDTLLQAGSECMHHERANSFNYVKTCENAGINNSTYITLLKKDSHFAYEGHEQQPRQYWEKLHMEAYNKESEESS